MKKMKLEWQTGVDSKIGLSRLIALRGQFRINTILVRMLSFNS